VQRNFLIFFKWRMPLESWVRSEPTTAARIAESPPPTSSGWALETPLTLSRQGLCRRPSGGTAAATVGSEIVLQPPPPIFFNTNPTRPGREQGGVALQDKDLCDVCRGEVAWVYTNAEEPSRTFVAGDHDYGAA